ncbi:MAG: hypothetical protein KF869_08035 [Phycisphaeraceae bacterium]|nr:hypothetical protein [Phycisphaeraceae bacterium]
MKIVAWNPSSRFVTVRVDPWEHLEVCHRLVDEGEFRRALQAVNDAGLSKADCDEVANELFDLLLVYAESCGVCTRSLDHRFDIDTRAGLWEPSMPSTVPCHCCQTEVPSGRSVMIRGDTSAYSSEIPEKWKRPFTLSALAPEERAEFEAASARYNEKCEFRREFICEACYRQLDNRIGCGPVTTAAGPKTFGLAGKSRGGKAAVYSGDKWLNFLGRS